MLNHDLATAQKEGDEDNIKQCKQEIKQGKEYVKQCRNAIASAQKFQIAAQEAALEQYPSSRKRKREERRVDDAYKGRFELVMINNQKTICLTAAKKLDLEQGAAQCLVGCETISDHQGSNVVYGKIEDNSFQTLLINSTVCTRARLRAVSASNANAWLRAIPCIHNDLALEPQEMQVLLKWWLGLPVFSADSKCPFCSSALDPDCHHALTCRSGGDVIARHNKLRDCVANLCSKACLSPQLEKGPGIDFSRPADVLVPNWSLSNPAAFDLKVIHPLNTDLILEASLASGNSAEVGEIEKHAKNDQMCARLGWTCIPLVVEVYGGWGCEAKECYSRLSKRLAMQVGICETEALCQMYCLLAVTLMRQNARAILLRCARAPLLE
eukprot:Em0021g765a